MFSPLLPLFPSISLSPIFWLAVRLSLDKKNSMGKILTGELSDNFWIKSTIILCELAQLFFFAISNIKLFSIV
jgi:hypothetical protein